MLGIVILIYNSKDHVISLVRQIRDVCKIPFRIIIVDNTPDAPFQNEILKALEISAVSFSDVECSSDDTFYLPTHNNMGFAKGNNLGALFLKKNFPQLKYLLFANDDIILEDREIFHKLCQNLMNDPQIGCIGPQILGLNQKNQSPLGAPLSIYRYWSIYGLYPMHQLIIKIRGNKTSPYKTEKTLPVGDYPWLLGAFLLFPADLFFKIKMFDEDTFLYCEEIIIAEKLRALGKKFYFQPSTKITHLTSVSTKKNYKTSTQEIILHRSFKVYFRKYKNHSACAIAFLDLTFWVFRHIWRPLLNH